MAGQVLRVRVCALPGKAGLCSQLQQVSLSQTLTQNQPPSSQLTPLITYLNSAILLLYFLMKNFSSLNSGRVTSPHSYPSIGWKHLRKQRSMTVEKSSFSSSPSSPPPPSPRSSSPASPSLRSSSPQSPGHQLNKKKYEKSVCCNSQFSTQGTPCLVLRSMR